MGRIDKENYYLDIAQTVAGRSTCLRRCYGAILVKSDEIISTGYNGAPRGRRNCVDLNYCTREALNIPSGERYELCRSVHAEANAIISAARRDMITLIHRSYKMGLFTATHGTYSVRLSDGSFLITPFGFDRAYLEEDDLVRVKGGMKELGKTPSRAVLLHQKIYEQHPDVGAILLAHPVHAMAFAVTDAAFDARTIPESYILLRDVKTLPYEEIYREPDKMAAEFDVSHPVAIVENDCVIVTGNSLLQAFDRLEVMELTANSILDSQSLGSIVHISEAEIAELKTAFHLEG